MRYRWITRCYQSHVGFFMSTESDQTLNYRTYSEITLGQPDFQVEYFLDRSPELEMVIVTQGIRCDFRYEGEMVNYMIYPEFLDVNGLVILDKKTEVPKFGVANMWIFGDKSLHTHKLSIGVKGCWVVGSFILARVTVIKIF